MVRSSSNLYRVLFITVLSNHNKNNVRFIFDKISMWKKKRKRKLFVFLNYILLHTINRTKWTHVCLCCSDFTFGPFLLTPSAHFLVVKFIPFTIFSLIFALALHYLRFMHAVLAGGIHKRFLCDLGQRL